MRDQLLILFVEDEASLAEIIIDCLRSRNFIVNHESTAKGGLASYFSIRPDVVVLDVMLPDGSGFSVCDRIREVDKDTPLIFLTSRSMTEDVVRGFESGGNDYLKKPFSIEELIVRIKVLTSKNRLLVTSEPRSKIYVSIGTYQFQHNSCVLSFNGVNRTLTSRESEILQLFILNKNEVLDRNLILNQIWGNNDYFSGRSLDVFITKLRKYLKQDPALAIINIRGKGYKLID